MEQKILNPSGIIFDNHYTDSALKILLNPKERQCHKWVTPRSAVPYQDVLLSMLLHRKVYLSKPLWLSRFDEDRLRPYLENDLIEWVPDQNYREALMVMDKYYNLMHGQIDFTNGNMEISLDYRQTARGRRDELISMDERFFDMKLILKKIFFASPILNANLRHLKFDGDAMHTLNFPLKVNSFHLLPLTIISPPESEERLIESSFADVDFRESNPEYSLQFKGSEEFYRHQAILNDSIASSIAICSFASRFGLPIKSNTLKNETKSSGAIKSDRLEYQLVRLQFEKLRYPVLENVADVLRLRDDKYVDSYRKVISEYSARLRMELEGERIHVLSEFKRDLELATKSIEKNVSRASKIDSVIFYISLPLAIIGLVHAIPFSDIMGAAASSVARYFAMKDRRKLDWILFGRR